MKLLKTIIFFSFLFLVVALSTVSFAGFVSTEILTKHTGEGNDGSYYVATSSDGRVVAFSSDATNFAEDDNNNAADVFVYDNQTDTTERVSVDNNGVEGDSGSYLSSISADGRYVVFYSTATNLVADDTNGQSDVFVYDRDTDTIERVSVDDNGVEGDNGSDFGVISDDGRYVAFNSDATNLVVGDTNANTDVFVYDRNTDTVERVSISTASAEGNQGSDTPAISADGRYISFESDATNLVGSDSNVRRDVFVRDRDLDTTERVSLADGGVQGNGYSASSSISADGRYVAFGSDATNLVVGDSNGARDIFVFDRNTDTIELISSFYGDYPLISPDGRYVAYWSYDDDEGVYTTVLYDRNTDTEEVVSVNNDEELGNDDSVGDLLSIAMSSDANNVFFFSDATNLVENDANIEPDLFVRNVSEGTTERIVGIFGPIQGNNDMGAVAFSKDGNYLAFSSKASNLSPDDTNGTWDVFVFNFDTQVIERVSVASDGTGGNGSSGLSSFYFKIDISDDGRYVVFDSNASNLVPDDTNGQIDVFVHDRDTGTTERVSVDSNGDETSGFSQYPSISGDGRYVAFQSGADLTNEGDTAAFTGYIYVYDRDTDTIKRVSENSLGVIANNSSQHPDISGNGLFVGFSSSANNLVDVDAGGINDIFVYNLSNNTVELVSKSDSGVQANDNDIFDASLSDDGRYVAFYSESTNLIDGEVDDNDQNDIFVYDRTTDTIERASRNNDGEGADDENFGARISGDGRSVAFISYSENLIPGNTGNGAVVLYDLEANQIYHTLFDTNGDLVDGSADSAYPNLSYDGDIVAIISGEDNLVGNDENNSDDIFFVNFDNTAPTLSEGNPIGTTNDRTPRFTFTSDEAGTISYEGSCGSVMTATVGDNTVNLNELEVGTYDDCTITVTDNAGNESDTLTITPFIIERQSSSGSSATSNNLFVNNILPIIPPFQNPPSCLPGQLYSANTGTPCGNTYTPNPQTSISKYLFTKNLWARVVDPEVKELQKYLNAHGYPLTTYGPGSLGQETNKFGNFTIMALKKFQSAHGLKPDAVVGPLTRGALNASN